MAMRAGATVWARIGALCAVLAVALALALAPAVEAATHGPGALAAEADHRAHHAEHGPAHDLSGPGPHDAGDHDHVPAVLAFASPAGPDLPPDRALGAAGPAREGTIRDGPRRPPRRTAP
jgi:hypothetical protein